jgi:hypothetical protein
MGGLMHLGRPRALGVSCAFSFPMLDTRSGLVLNLFATEARVAPGLLMARAILDLSSPVSCPVRGVRVLCDLRLSLGPGLDSMLVRGGDVVP